MENAENEVLNKIAEQGMIANVKSTPEHWSIAIEKLKAHGLITDVQQRYIYKLTQEGYKAVSLGGFNGWLESVNKRESQSRTGITVAGNALIGNNNSGNNVGQDFEVFPQIQPITSPSQYANQSSTHEVKVSKAQFIFWLFSAFASGIAVGIAITKYLHG